MYFFGMRLVLFGNILNTIGDKTLCKVVTTDHLSLNVELPPGFKNSVCI